MTPILEHLEIIIHDTLAKTPWGGNNAEKLLLRTLIVESDSGKHLIQANDGPAVSFFQLEPATIYDIVDNYLVHRMDDYRLVSSFTTISLSSRHLAQEVRGNIQLSVLFARLQYLRAKGAIPLTRNIFGQMTYWKHKYNTVSGKGSIPKAVSMVMDAESLLHT